VTVVDSAKSATRIPEGPEASIGAVLRAEIARQCLGKEEKNAVYHPLKSFPARFTRPVQ
jgi:hypothetical protein